MRRSTSSSMSSRTLASCSGDRGARRATSAAVRITVSGVRNSWAASRREPPHFSEGSLEPLDHVVERLWRAGRARRRGFRRLAFDRAEVDVISAAVAAIRSTGASAFRASKYPPPRAQAERERPGREQDRQQFPQSARSFGRERHRNLDIERPRRTSGHSAPEASMPHRFDIHGLIAGHGFRVLRISAGFLTRGPCCEKRSGLPACSPETRGARSPPNRTLSSAASTAETLGATDLVGKLGQLFLQRGIGQHEQVVAQQKSRSTHPKQTRIADSTAPYQRVNRQRMLRASHGLSLKT